VTEKLEILFGKDVDVSVRRFCEIFVKVQDNQDD
jgi:hypothetical protein